MTEDVVKQAAREWLEAEDHYERNAAYSKAFDAWDGEERLYLSTFKRIVREVEDA